MNIIIKNNSFPYNLEKKIQEETINPGNFKEIKKSLLGDIAYKYNVSKDLVKSIRSSYMKHTMIKRVKLLRRYNIRLKSLIKKIKV